MIQNFFSKKSVSNVLAAFNAVIDDLKQVENEQEAEAVKQSQIAVEAQAAHEAAIKEAAMAREVQEKLTAIVVPTLPSFGVASLAAFTASSGPQ